MAPRERRSALVIFALLVPSLAALWWATQLAGSLPRPGALRAFASEGRPFIGFFFDDALHLLDAQGERVVRQPLADLSLTEEPTDFDVTVDAAGRTQAWLFEDTTPRVVRCEVEAQPLRLAACVQVMAGPQLKLQPLSGAVHIAVDVIRKRIFVADAQGQGVRMLDLQGRRVADVAPGRLFFPNRVRLDGDQLVVADNDHQQLLWLDVAGEPPDFRVRTRLYVPGHPLAQERRKAADFALRRGGGEVEALWVLAVAQGQQNGRVLLYGQDLVPGPAGDLGGHADPLVIERFGEALVAADFRGLALYRIGRDGSHLGPFGTGAFADELAAARAQERAAQTWRFGGLAGLAFTFLVGFALAWRSSERPGQQLAHEAFAGLEGVGPLATAEPVELAPGPWYARHLFMLQAATLVAALAVIAVSVGLRWERMPAPARWWTGAGILLVPAVGLAGAWLSWRAGRLRLWLEGGSIALRLGARAGLPVAMASVLASPRALVVAGQVLPYRVTGLSGRPGRWIYDEDLLTRGVLARLAPDQRVTDLELVREFLRRLAPWRVAALGLLLLAMPMVCLWIAWR